MVRNTSGRHASGGYLTVEFSSDESGPKKLRFIMAYGGLHITRQEDMKNVVSQEGHQQKTFDGVGQGLNWKMNGKQKRPSFVLQIYN